MAFRATPAYSVASRLEEAIAAGWNPVCHLTYTRDAWVTLLEPLTEFACDEAMLLCQDADESWIAWVPDHGEVVLNRSQFY
jgi:hypothetical protein